MNDDENFEQMAVDDPLATQIWRLYSRTKAQLPNAERLENLTWRMMSMKMKEQRMERDGCVLKRLLPIALVQTKSTRCCYPFRLMCCWPCFGSGRAANCAYIRQICPYNFPYLLRLAPDCPKNKSSRSPLSRFVLRFYRLLQSLTCDACFPIFFVDVSFLLPPLLLM